MCFRKKTLRLIQKQRAQAQGRVLYFSLGSYCAY